jgi:hypothetical protein
MEETTKKKSTINLRGLFSGIFQAAFLRRALPALKKTDDPFAAPEAMPAGVFLDSFLKGIAVMFGFVQPPVHHTFRK